MISFPLILLTKVYMNIFSCAYYQRQSANVFQTSKGQCPVEIAKFRLAYFRVISPNATFTASHISGSVINESADERLLVSYPGI